MDVLPPELPDFDGKPAELPAPPAGVSREPARCRALLTPAPQPPPPSCATRDDAVQLLAGVLDTKPPGAMRETHVAQPVAAPRDRALHALERCEGFPPGFVRALRAELERDCSETLATPWLRRPLPGTSAELVHTLQGLALASRFVRAVAPSPVMPEPVDRARITAFVAGPLTRHREVTEARLEQLASALARLPENSHGHAVALAGQAVAWQRLRALRGQTLPDTLKRTHELRVDYFRRVDALSQELEQKALRFTREATESASLHGLLRDRALTQHLAQVFAPSRLRLIDLPPTPRPLPPSPWYRVASQVPARYPAELLTRAELEREQTAAELAPGGLSLRQKRALVRPGARSELHTLAALHLKLALVLHRDEELREASRLAELVESRPDVGSPSDTQLLLRALIRDLLRAAPGLETAAAVPADFVPSALLALADDRAKDEQVRALAGYDAALLMSASPQTTTLLAAHQRLEAARATLSDAGTRECAAALQRELEDAGPFEPAPTCRSWPWLED